ncbi:hypothetical protein GCM10007860_06600 [Chitiniphilus shinanonensis]|uniref:DUF6708 domain-containing protein n=2 Tax=Chitiniphilus shinanonensis TaxID=553088 RepID=A0ABQ6BNS4_9NEIS|nr:DUF6708 domain-containing protein [Chitiniphilus shinanonensis]GLS03516.1 hypothetical protein GCM10007860_06600 [Chitiniphilus shinanonensis]
MDYAGLTAKYKVNRPLSDAEKQHHLPQTKASSAKPLAQTSVIQMNSTYLECSDKFYPWKGLMTAFTGFVIWLIGYALSSVAIISITEWPGINADQRQQSILTFLAMCAMSAPVILLALWFLKKEAFRYTHYPLRFNRKTGMVHVFRLDGTTLSVPWREIHFALNPAQMRNFWEVRGHVLSEDRSTVLETFVLPTYASWESPYLLAQWEFVRHYMEKGPAQLLEQVQYTLNIADRRETLWFGFRRLMAIFSSAPLLALLMSPLLLPLSIVRWITMRTCKIPQWPEEVEAQSQISPKDRYRRDAHPPYVPPRQQN